MSYASDALIQAVIDQESGGDPNSVSPKGARGKMQVMPGTGVDPGYGVKPLANSSSTENVRFGTDYLNAMLKHYGGDQDAALIAYNGGPKRADAWLAAGRDDSVIPAESVNYYKQVAGRLGGNAAVSSAGPSSAGSDWAAAAGATNSAGTKPMDQELIQPLYGPSVDFGPLPSERKKAMAQAMMQQALDRSGSHYTRGGALAQAFQMFAADRMGKQYEDQKNERGRKMAEALMGAQGNDQLIRTLFASQDPDLIKAAASNKMRMAEDAKRRGLAVVPMTDPDGNVVNGTVGADGSWSPLKTSGDYKASPKATTRIVGTERITTDAYGNVLGREPVDISGAASEREQGTEAGKARMALPGVKTQVDNALNTIEQLRNHSGRETGTGLSSKLDPRNYLAGTDATDFNIMNKQAKAQAFMAAREGLKGAGQVTDFEGDKGETAIAALDTAQSDEQYLKALNNLERMMRASYEDLKRKASLDKVSKQGDRPLDAAGAPSAPAASFGTPKPKTLKYNPATGNLE